MSPAKPIKFGIQLPEWFDRRLRLWAAWKGSARATLAANILQARIEANWPEVEKWIEEEADRRGLTREQFEAELLDSSDSEES